MLSPLDADDITRLSSYVKVSPVAGIELSPWIVVEDFCATRVVAGTDPNVVANRRAFIEKTPRVMVGDDATNWRCWFEGPKGSGGADGHIPENELYGFYPRSREWCDAALLLLGAVLPDPCHDLEPAASPAP